LRDLPEQTHVHLGVERRRVEVAVAQHGPDGVERGAVAQEPGRE
jgi:hypothetical protein